VTTLVLYFHAEHERSKTNRAMAGAAGALEGVTLVNMGALYPDVRAIDVDAEVQRLLSADRLVLQFPIHWYLPPPLLSAWQNVVLTRMFYIKAEDEGARIKDVPLLVAATAGNTPEAYSPEGVNLFALTDLLKPLHASAHRCGLAWQDPFLVYRANRLDEEGRVEVAAAYAARIAAPAE
jgi:putative NADPH-quinone reductase